MTFLALLIFIILFIIAIYTDTVNSKPICTRCIHCKSVIEIKKKSSKQIAYNIKCELKKDEIYCCKHCPNYIWEKGKI